MFYHWLAPLGKKYIIFNLFNYISFRAAGATVTALLLAFFVGPPVIARLRARKVGQIIRAEGPGEPPGQARARRRWAGSSSCWPPSCRRCSGRRSPIGSSWWRCCPSSGWVHRISGRLPQDRAGQVARSGGQVEAGRAGELRSAARARSWCIFPLVPRRHHPGHGHDASLLQVSGGQLRALALRGLRHAGHHRLAATR